MKSTPILFTGSNVTGILEGRKTQTRRVVKPQPSMTSEGPVWYAHFDKVPGTIQSNFPLACHCPYGEPGDQLWVKETFWFSEYCSPHSKPCKEAIGEGWGILYAATDDMNSPNRPIKKTEERLRPSILMPRWASRITLEIIAVRVERLQDISDVDAIAEGCNGVNTGDFITDYAELWESINGPGSWEKNPWVWVIEFKRI